MGRMGKVVEGWGGTGLAKDGKVLRLITKPAPPDIYLERLCEMQARQAVLDRREWLLFRRFGLPGRLIFLLTELLKSLPTDN